jgi:hypothetical protein
MTTTEAKPKMSTGKAVFTVVMLVFWVGLAIYFGIKAFSGMQEIAETPAEDAYYDAHGCYISDGGNMYTCPNGAPPQPDANPDYFAQWKESQ